MTWTRRNYRWILTLPILFYALTLVKAATNVTVDDERGDSKTGATPTYSPSGVWEQGNTCSGCLVQPNSADAFDGTWHDSTWATNDEAYTITINFTGTAVYAYFILANTVTGATTLTNMSFTIDGSVVGHFVHEPTSSTDYVYDYAAYVNKSLDNTDHTIVISAVGTTSNSLILFDRLIYTTEDTTTSSATSAITSATSSGTTDQTSSSSSNTGAITGGVVAAVVVILVGLAIVFLLRRRKRKRNDMLIHQEEMATARPFDMIDYHQGHNNDGRRGRNMVPYTDERSSFLPVTTPENSNGVPSSSGASERIYPSTATTATADAIAPSRQILSNTHAMNDSSANLSANSPGSLSQANLGLIIRNGDEDRVDSDRLKALSEKASLLESIAPSSMNRSQAGGSSSNSGSQRVDPEHALMDRIATLEAEVARLNGQTQLHNGEEPPPDYYTTENL